MTTEARAEMRRELIRAANTHGYNKSATKGLITFADNTYQDNIMNHPSFPLGVLYAYEHAEKKK